MRNLIGLALVSVVGIMTGCAGDHAFGSRQAAHIGWQVYWDTPARLDEGETITRLYRVDEMLYCMTSNNRVIAKDAMTGITLWSATIDEPGKNVYRPVHAKNASVSEETPGIRDVLSPKKGSQFDTVMFNTNGRLIIIDRKTGAIIRRIDLNFPISAGGTTDGTAFYAGSVQGWFRAISIQQEVTLWTMDIGDMVSAPLEFYEGIVYVAGQNGRFGAVRSSGLKPEFVFPPRKYGGAISAAFHVGSRGCFIPCEDGRLYSMSLETQEPLWPAFVCQGPLRYDVQVGDRTVFQRAAGDKFYAINVANGQQRWTSHRGAEVLAVVGGDVYLRDIDNRIEVIDENLGTVKKAVSLEGLDLFVPSTSSVGIWAASRGGRVVCLRPASASFVTKEMLEARESK